MPRDYRPSERAKRCRALRAYAIDRGELREPTTEREPAAGVTSMALKARDHDTERMVREFLQKRGA